MRNTILRILWKSVLIVLVGGFLASCFNSNADAVPRTDFVKSVSSMFKVSELTDHFPESWLNTNKRSITWNASYFSPCDDSVGQCFRCMACYTVKVSEKYIDNITHNIQCDYITRFYSDSVLRFNPVYIRDTFYRLPSYCDTVHIPFYDFSEASFNNEIVEDSIFSMGRYWYGEHQIPPSDLIVYVIEAKAGNFWMNQYDSEKENRSVLPQKWRHGYSRGIAVSRSCKKVCWWAMAW